MANSDTPGLNPAVGGTEPAFGSDDAEQALGQVKRASVRGMGANMAAQMTRLVLQFAYQIVIARLLTPHDFGLVALTAPIIAFVAMFADLGLSQATVQRSSISQEQLSFIFWVNVAAGAALATITIIAAPLVGWFYHDPRVIGITVVSGSLFLLGGLYTQHLAVLNRHMRFIKLATIDLCSFVAGAIVGIASALLGWGYWSIVFNSATISVTSLLLAWLTTDWRPSMPRRAADDASLLRFGGNLTGFNFVNYFARNLDNVLIGRFVGEVGLGFYDRAYKLLVLPLSQISAPLSRVAVPLLSRTQGTPYVYRRAYLRTLELTILLTFPFMLVAIVDSHDLVRVVLGERWLGAAPIFAVLAIGSLQATISNSTGWLFISQGRTREMRNQGLITAIYFVLSFIVGLPWGAVGVATFFTIVSTLRAPFLWLSVTRVGPVRTRDLARALAPPLVATVVVLPAEYLAQRILPAGALSLIALTIASYGLFVGVLAVAPGGRLVLIETLDQLANVIRKTRSVK